MIQTFGDSHSMFAWKDIDGVRYNWLGPKLMYSFGNDSKIVDLSSVKKDDIVVFCFGEIDARCHVYKHISENKTYKNIIDDLVENYFRSIKKITDGIVEKIWIYNVVPPIKYSGPNDFDFPYLGKDEERLEYVRYFNEIIKKECEKNGYIFFDVYKKYACDDGFLNPSYSDGGCHINNPIYIIEFINKIFNDRKGEYLIHPFFD